MQEAGGNESTLVSQEEDALPASHPTKSRPENTPHSPLRQCELVDPEPTGSTSLDSMDEELQASDDSPAPLRLSSRRVRKQLPLRYWNFAAWQNDTPTSTLDWWAGLCFGLYILSCLQTGFVRGTV